MTKAAIETTLTDDHVENKDNFKALLSIKDYRLLISGQLISMLGDGVYTLALIWTMKVLTGSAVLMSVVLAAEIIPLIFFGIFAGVLVDRGNPKKYMLIADIWRGVVILSIFVLLLVGHLSPWMLIVSAVVTSSFDAFFSPAKTVSIRAIVPDHLMTRAQSLSATIQTVVGLVAPALGALLLSLHLPTAFLFNAITFFLSFMLISFIRQSSLPEQSTEKLDVKTFTTDLKTGFKTIISVPLLRGMIIYLVLINFMLAPVSVLFPLFVEDASQLATVQIFFTVGILIGSIAINLFNKYKKIIPMLVGLTLLLVAFAALAFIDNYLIILALVLCAGLGSIFASIALQTVFITKVPREFLGRSQSTMRVLLESSRPLALLMTGSLLVYFSISSLFLGIAIFGGLVVLLMISNPAIRKSE